MHNHLHGHLYAEHKGLAYHCTGIDGISKCYCFSRMARNNHKKTPRSERTHRFANCAVTHTVAMFALAHAETIQVGHRKYNWAPDRITPVRVNPERACSGDPLPPGRQSHGPTVKLAWPGHDLEIGPRYWPIVPPPSSEPTQPTIKDAADSDR